MAIASTNNPMVYAQQTKPNFSPDIQAIIDAITKGFQQTQPAPVKSFDQMGLYNDKEAQAQGQAEYAPYYQQQLNKSLGEVGSNYGDRNLLHSGGYNLVQGKTRQANAEDLNTSIAQYKNDAYGKAWNKYLQTLQSQY